MSKRTSKTPKSMKIPFFITRLFPLTSQTIYFTPKQILKPYGFLMSQIHENNNQAQTLHPTITRWPQTHLDHIFLEDGNLNLLIHYLERFFGLIYFTLALVIKTGIVKYNRNKVTRCVIPSDETKKKKTELKHKDCST